MVFVGVGLSWYEFCQNASNSSGASMLNDSNFMGCFLA